MRPSRLITAIAALVMATSCTAAPAAQTSSSASTRGISASAALAVASTSPAEPTPPATSRTAPTAPVTDTAPSTAAKRKATDEAQFLATGVVLPPGSTSARPDPTLIPAYLTHPASTTAVVTRWWTVPLDENDALTWVLHHLPPAVELWPGDGPGPVYPLSVLYIDENDTTANRIGGQLLVSPVVLSKKSTLLRIDGTDRWLDPRPLQDRTVGRRITPTVEAGCAVTDQGIVGITSPHASDRALVTNTAPESALVCVWHGSQGDQAWKLDSTEHLATAQARTVATKIAALPLSHPDVREFNCSITETQAAELVVFHDTTGPDVALWIANRQCETLSNGRILIEPFDETSVGLAQLPAR